MSQPEVSGTAEIYLPGISYYKLCSLVYCSFYLQTDDRMRYGGIAADRENTGSIADFMNGISHGSAAEGGGQTGHSRRMSETGTMVDSIGT